MKLNWGLGIALFYASFMVILLYFVVKSTTYDKSLVLDNYYEQDINYQAHFVKKTNNMELAQPVQVLYNANKKTVELRFPEGLKDISGSVQIFHPSMKSKDLNKKIKLDEQSEMSIGAETLESGKWKVILDWKDDQKSYYTESIIFL